MQYVVYMVRCADDSLYTGITCDLARRLAQHNGALRGGSRYTRSRRPVHLVYMSPTASKSEALRQEHIIQALSKPEKEKLVHIAQTRDTLH